jgi:hypothetical protein
MYTEGTPAWLLSLEVASDTLADEDYIRWLINTAGTLGVPVDVIKEQLRRRNYQLRIDDYIEGDTDVKVKLPPPAPKVVRRKK